MGVIIEMSNKHNLIRPVYPSSGSAGIRFFSQCDYYIEPFSFKAIGTGFRSILDSGECGVLSIHSELFQRGLMGHTGTIDSDYANEIYFYVYNVTKRGIKISKGDILGQMLVTKVEKLNGVDENFGVRTGIFGRIGK